ncbi:hypothetical protein [Roseomonas sp. USHLN139]|uniref:hypothetical protein n=1 Tax=Roseomonas sp. USHLN139 TaxID=3081298 RepID=UPI003B0282B0
MPHDIAVPGLTKTVLDLNEAARKIADAYADVRGPWPAAALAEHARLCGELDEATDVLAETSAHTLHGCREKAAVALTLYSGEGTGHEALLLSVARDLAGLQVRPG